MIEKTQSRQMTKKKTTGKGDNEGHLRKAIRETCSAEETWQRPE
jgi:hypothetical protein